MATINTLKEQAASSRPILLCSFKFPDASELNVASIAVTHASKDYLARVVDPSLDQLSALSEQGIDRVPSVSVKLADPDAFLWQNYERAAGKGFKGAMLTVTLALHDALTGEFSTDSFVPFLGLCGQPAMDDQHLTVNAVSRLNLTRYSLPTVPIQTRCPWINPANTTGADATAARFAFCGASSPCSNTKATCTVPLRFGGVTYEPPKSGSGREYISGSKVAWRNADTSNKFGEKWPLWLGGVAWLDAPVLNQVGDGNFTRGEAAIGVGEIEVEAVIVNGVELGGMRTGDYRWHYVNQGARDGAPNTDRPYNGEGDPYGNLTVIQFLAPRAIIDPASTANVRVRGRRKNLRIYKRIVSISGGVVTLDGANEDCAGNSPFTVTIEGNSGVNGTFGLTSWSYGPPGTVTLSGSTGSGTGGTLCYENSAISPQSGGGACSPWALMELLKWARFDYQDFTTLDFADVAKICNTPISYTDQNGNTSQQVRFSTAIALRQRRSAAEVVRGIRQSIGALLVPGSDGKLRLKIEGTLAEQQPSAVDGSNYNTAVSSKLRTGTATSGYVAYKFDEQTSWSWKRLAGQLDAMPNKVAFGFQDPSVGYATSTYSMVDSDDVARTDQETPGGLQVEPEGIASHNHALRAGKLGLAKIHRGNPQSDTRGTDYFEWTTSFRGCKLTVGQIVMASNTRLGLSNQLIRLTGIKPTSNYQYVTLTGHWHSDDWYQDSAGSAADPGYSSPRVPAGSGVPFPWRPYKEQPIVTGNAGIDVPGSLFDASAWSFGLTQVYETSADGTRAAYIEIAGKVPTTEFANLSVPLLARQGSTASTGGTIPGAAGVEGGVRKLYVSVSAKDSAGRLTPASPPCVVDITAETDTNTVTVPVLSWDPATSGGAIFAGWSPAELCWQADFSGTSPSVGLTDLKSQTWAPPDTQAASLRARVKRVVHSGVAGVLVSSVDATAITCTDLVDAGDDWTGRDVSIIADAADGSAAMWNFVVVEYDPATGRMTTSPVPSGVEEGDVLIVRTAPPNLQDWDKIGDLGFQNKFAAAGLEIDAERGRVVRIIAGAGKGQVRRITGNSATHLYVDPEWDERPDQTSRFIVEAPEWEFSTDTRLQPNSDPAAEVTLRVPVANFLDQVVLVEVAAMSAQGLESASSLNPKREIWLFGSTSAKFPEGYYAVPVDGASGEAVPDTGMGVNQQITMTRDVIVKPAISTSILAGDRMTIKLVQDSTGGRMVAWDTVYVGLANIELDLTESTYSMFSFVFNSDDKWELRSSQLGLSLT